MWALSAVQQAAIGTDLKIHCLLLSGTPILWCKHFDFAEPPVRIQTLRISQELEVFQLWDLRCVDVNFCRFPIVNPYFEFETYKLISINKG